MIDQRAAALRREDQARLLEAGRGQVLYIGRLKARRDSAPGDGEHSYSVWGPRSCPCGAPDWQGTSLDATLNILAADRARTLTEDRYV